VTDDIQKQAGQIYMRCPRCGLILGQNTSAELCPHDDPACGACCSKYHRTDPVPENIVPFKRKESSIMPSTIPTYATRLYRTMLCYVDAARKYLVSLGRDPFDADEERQLASYLATMKKESEKEDRQERQAIALAAKLVVDLAPDRDYAEAIASDDTIAASLATDRVVKATRAGAAPLSFLPEDPFVARTCAIPDCGQGFVARQKSTRMLCDQHVGDSTPPDYREKP